MLNRIRRRNVRRELWLERGRMLAVGVAVGIVVAELADPVSGRRRRKMILGRTGGAIRHGRRRTARLGRFAVSRSYGLTQRAIHVRERRKDLDDATLADKIRSEVFRPADIPKGQINVNVQKGVVQLRGELTRPELITELESHVRRIQGVRDVENLLHLPHSVPQMHH